MSGAATPTRDGFLAWVRSIMAVPVGDLPDDSVWLTYAYDISIATVNEALVAVPPIYMLAVYNLGGDILINIAQDIPPSTYWAALRVHYGTWAFAPGLVSSSADQGTSTSLLNPDFMKELTLANLQQMKSPYGRQYLAWAQSYGTLWGLT